MDATISLCRNVGQLRTAYLALQRRNRCKYFGWAFIKNTRERGIMLKLCRSLLHNQTLPVIYAFGRASLKASDEQFVE